MRTVFILVMALGLLGCRSAGVDSGSGSTGQVGVTQINTQNQQNLLFEQVLGDGATGDYAIYNDLVHAVIDQLGQNSSTGTSLQHYWAPTGGTILDFGVWGGADQLVQIYQVLDFDNDLRISYVSMAMTADGESLILDGWVLDPGGKLGLATNDAGYVTGLNVITTYGTTAGEPWIELSTTIVNRTGFSLQIDGVCDMVISDGKGLDPFVPSPQWGWDLLPSQRTTVPWVVFSGDYEPAASYAFISTEHDFMDILGFADDDGRLRAMAVGPVASEDGALANNETRTWTRKLLVQADNSPAGVTGELLSLISEQDNSAYVSLGLVYSSLLHCRVKQAAEPEAVFWRSDPARYVGSQGQILDGALLPVSAKMLTWAGSDVMLPWGTYRVTVDAYGYETQESWVQVGDSSEDQLSISLQEQDLESLKVTVVDTDGDPVVLPYRLTLKGLGGTPDPSPAVKGDGAYAAGNRIWLGYSSIDLLMQPGSYQVIASRGPLYEAAVLDFNVPATHDLELVLGSEALDNGGYIAIDPVVSTRLSAHGGNTISELALALQGEGIDFFVRTEAQQARAWNDGQADLPGATGILGTLDVPRVGSRSGDGWYCAFPVSTDLPGPGVKPAVWLDLSQEAGAQFTAILAPWAKGTVGYGTGLFSAHGFDSSLGLLNSENSFLFTESEQGSTLLDFDAIEIMSVRSPWDTGSMVEDWFAFLDAGFPLMPIASSSVAYLEYDRPGAARTMLLVEGETTESTVAKAGDQGQGYVTSGPVIQFTVQTDEEEALPGGTLTTSDGRVTVNVVVSAPTWVPVERVRIWANSDVVRQWDTDETSQERISESVPLMMPQGGWIVVDAGRAGREPEPPFAYVYPDMPSYAITAPVLVEVDQTEDTAVP